MRIATVPITRRRVIVGALVLAVAACGGPDADTPVGDSTTAIVADAPAGTATPAATDAAGCRLAGAWQRCSVVESIERAGYRLELLRDSLVRDGLDVRGAAYRVGSAELQLFVFADSTAAARAAARVDADDAEAAETRGIRRPPAVIRSNNLVALLFDNNDRLRERIRLALAAGLPPA